MWLASTFATGQLRSRILHHHNIDEEEKLISMEIAIDTDICPVMEYFEIFMSRMLMCRRAADALGCEFELLTKWGQANLSKVVEE